MGKFKILEIIKKSFRIVFEEPSIIGIFLLPVLVAATVFVVITFSLGIWTTLQTLEFIAAKELIYLPQVFLSIALTLLTILVLGLAAIWIVMSGVGGLILKVEAKMKKKKMKFSQALKRGFENSWRMFIAYLGKEGITTLGYIFLIIPGIYFMVKLALVLPACILEKKGFGIKRSWEATRGNFWRILLFVVLWGIVFWITSFIPFLIIFWILLFPAYITALTLVYMKLRR